MITIIASSKKDLKVLTNKYGNALENDVDVIIIRHDHDAVGGGKTDTVIKGPFTKAE